MKTIQLTLWIVVVLLSAGAAAAQGRHGDGFGGPPQTEGDRSVRREECQNTSGGASRKTGDCDRQGPGKGMRRSQENRNGNGQGRGRRNGGGANRGGGN